MATPMISVQVPEPLYRRLERAAKLMRRSVDDVLATTIATALRAGRPVQNAARRALADRADEPDRRLASHCSNRTRPCSFPC